jgi:hypothetical protein
MADTTPSFFTQSTTLSPEAYANSYVDFYNQTLGTGIKVETIAEKEEEDQQVQPAVLSPVSAGADDSMAPPPVTATVLGKGRVAMSDPTKSVVYDNISSINYNSYDDFTAAQQRDMVDFGLSGDFKFERPDKTKFAAEIAVEQILPMGSLIGGVLSGEARPAPFGNDSYRPSGLLGAAWDAAMYFHSKDVAAIRAAADPATGKLTGGFMMELNGMKITRAPGRLNYYGNLQNLEQTQVRALEETMKGYIPGSMQETYDEDTKTWKTTGTAGLLPPEIAQKLGGNYTAYGTFVDAYGQGSAYGSQEAAQELAKFYNVDYNTATRMLSDLRKEAPMFAKGAKAPSDVVNAAIQRFKDAGTQPEEETPAAAVRATPQVAPEDEGLPPGDEGPTVADVASLYQQDDDDSSGGYQPSYDPATFDTAEFMREGGRIGMQQGGVAQMPSGFVDRPPEQVPDGQTVADNVPAELPEGTFVINAAAVEFAGSADVKKMIEDAQKEAAKAGAGVDKSVGDGKLIDVAVSRGEVIVAPQIAKIIGYDRLNKINNRGKEEVRRRQQETQQAATGGFIGKAEGGDVTVRYDYDYTEPPAEKKNPSLNYEDRIIVDEVRRKMFDLIDITKADEKSWDIYTQQFEEDPMFVSTVEDRFGKRKVNTGPIYRRFFERLGRINDMQVLGGSYSSGGRDINAPLTPTLFNLFVLAEELAHSGIPEQKTYKRSYGYNPDVSPDMVGGIVEEENSLFEELRAKRIAFETVKGLLPKSKKFAKLTEDHYRKIFKDYLEKGNAPAEVKDYMAREYSLDNIEYEIGRTVKKPLGVDLTRNETVDDLKKQRRLFRRRDAEASRLEAQAEGFVKKAEGGDVGEDIPMDEYGAVPKETLRKFAEFGKRKQQRSQIKDFINSLSDEEALALLILTETVSSIDTLESMEAIGEVVKNRAETDYRDFKNVNTIKDVMLQQTAKGAFQFSGLEPTTLYERLTEVREGLASKGLEKTLAAAENVLSTEPDREAFKRLPVGTLFYKKPNAPSRWMENSPDLEYATEIGGHEFYRTFKSPEYP